MNALALPTCSDWFADLWHLQWQLGRPMGATAVLEGATATPPTRKSLAKGAAAPVTLKGKKRRRLWTGSSPAGTPGLWWTVCS